MEVCDLVYMVLIERILLEADFMFMFFKYNLKYTFKTFTIHNVQYLACIAVLQIERRLQLESINMWHFRICYLPGLPCIE
ncbi:hypothetical protein Fmac_013463 [Flemingia macrophylla]|uniref:Uncharacterized protein n=1 Tax=Flemingia macrophylla TaxID=520843 RepID=A0ABD1MU26_9FABA